MIDLMFELDTRQLEAWAAQTTKEMTRQLRGAVDKSARYARAQTIPVMAKDSGVPAARFRAATPLVRGSSASDLSAKWTVAKSANFIRGAAGSYSTFAVTGGGSASLSLPKAFSLGGKGVFVRRGPGKQNFKPVYAESPVTGMSQEDGAPRKKWEEAGEVSLSLLTAAAVQAALKGSSSEPRVPGLSIFGDAS